MEFKNPFVLDNDQYNRDINMFNHYVTINAQHLSRMTGDPIGVCRKFIIDGMKTKGGPLSINDPIITYFERDQNTLDRESTKCKLSDYFGKIVREKNIVAPTLTVYLNPTVKKSLLTDFVDANKKARYVSKHAMFVCKMNKDMDGYNINNTKQTNAKLSNNALSGAHVSNSTPLANKTAHSSLTSTCRSTSGYGNANNEKMLSGNRHYRSAKVVINNILTIVANSDYKAIEETIKTCNLKIPNYFETIECIAYSLELYSRDRRAFREIEKIVAKLSDLERAAFVYTGDLYHIAKLNPEYVRTFLSRLASRVTNTTSDVRAILKSVSDSVKCLAVQICSIECKGKKLADLEGKPEEVVVAATIENIHNTITDYTLFIRTFFTSTNLPASVAYFPDSIRRAALTSDTDSTIFTVENWVEWYFGKPSIGEKENALSAAMIFLSEQTIVHVLAIMSSNIGIEKSRLNDISMKNEYKFDVFIPTPVAKHYFALIGCQEGNLYDKYDIEIKGVHLKSSNVPKAIMKRAKEMMTEIMNTVVEGKKISVLKYLKEIADVERSIADSIRKGENENLRLAQIKSADSYKKDEISSPYAFYSFWNDVFGPKYGYCEKPPYTALKISTEVTKTNLLNEWLLSIEDRELADRLGTWLRKYNKTTLSTIFIPDSIIQSKGIPIEIMDVINVRKIILDSVSVFYIILECLGIYMLNNKNTKLASDIY